VNTCKSTIVTTSWDDGHPLDLRLAGMLSRYGVKGTFYVATENRQKPVMRASELREISRSFEIGAHSLSHRKLRGLSRKTLQQEIRGGKAALEEILGRPVRMFCYPWGRHSRQVRFEVGRAGFVGARTTRQFCLRCKNDPLQMPTTMQAFPHPAWRYVRHCSRTANWHGMVNFWRAGPTASMAHRACDLFHRARQEGGVWHLWGHSWELDAFNLWADVEAILRVVGGHSDVRYLTNGEVIQEMVINGQRDVAA